ncbi:FACT complex subunit ctc-2 [Daldinia childiae]|uniref:FACT complex subunit ctc-2 n=1 Tax=Daldinia childiae TaxID=326645 RepID=UPI00144735F3|nr:FACT complex subunit ctc-2 [Daldinia childiae]KAF3057945.1 FACT complex subunit ctc-2 [Daldinia childiae]
MADIKIDGKLFQERINHFINAWKADKRAGDTVFSGVSSILIMMGKVEENPEFQKNNAMHFWLLGYEFPTTLMLITTDTLYILTTAKKAKHLEQLKGGRFPIEVLVRGKDVGCKREAIHQDCRYHQFRRIGLLTKDRSNGPFVDEWKKVFGDKCKDAEEVDISGALSTAAFSVKDETELRSMRAASKACVALMTPFFLDQMSDVLDQEKKVKHSALADKVDRKLDDEKWWKTVELPNKQRLPSDFDPASLDWYLGPAVQSGGKYDLKLQTEPTGDNLHPGVIIADARKYLQVSLSVHNLVLKEIKDGVVAKDVYSKALSYIKSKKPELEKHFLKNVGAGIGIESKDPTLVLSGKNSRTLKDGMTLCITTGFTDVENPSPKDKLSKTYSLVLTDTIRVTNSDPVVFTGDAPTDLDATSFFLQR